jgi:hypothetical protein
MPDVSPIPDYASPPPARKMMPTILWWFFADAAIFLGAIGYMMFAFDGVGPYEDLPQPQQGILDLWLLVALALFMFLLGWATGGWWRSRRAG